jgi:hypothetical protein
MQTSNAAEACARAQRRRHGGPFPLTGLAAMIETMTPRRFPAPWTAEKIAGGYVADRSAKAPHAAVKAELRREAGASAKR